jgi:endonuclease YncB( thermonuclease family)
MKHSVYFFLSRLIICAAFIVVCGSLVAAESAVIEAKVVGVTDGDTFTGLTNQNEQIKVRIYGIDAPEKKQIHGAKAKKFLSDMIFGQTVTIQPIQRDLYGRLIARVFVDEKDVGLTMVEYGHAWWYCKYAKKDFILKNAQSRAQNQELGLWQFSNPVPPWKFRDYKKQKKDNLL